MAQQLPVAFVRSLIDTKFIIALHKSKFLSGIKSIICRLLIHSLFLTLEFFQVDI